MSRVKFVLAYVSTCLFLVIILSAVAWGQSNIRIIRPVNGSTIRETVNILVPVSSVPDGGFVVYSIDGHFRVAQAIKTSDGRYYVYAWDTKAIDPDTDLPMVDRKPHDGRHTITVQACDATGNKIGTPKQVTVFVKNLLSPSDIPARGITLRYRQIARTTNKYKFDCHIDLTSVEGADPNLLKSVGEGIEGISGTVRNTVEYLVDPSKAFISQQLLNRLWRYNAGHLTLDKGVTGKQVYGDEDTRGNITRIATQNPGTSVCIDFPVLPSQRVKVGDVWRQPTRVLWDPESGRSVKMITTNTLEALEWERGYQCAKIRTTFSGTAKIPFSTTFELPVKMNGTIVTYFAFKVGKVIMSRTDASASVQTSGNLIANAVQAALPEGASLFPSQAVQRQGMGVFVPGGMRPGGKRGEMMAAPGGPVDMPRPGMVNPGMRGSMMSPRMMAGPANPGMVGGPPTMEHPGLNGPMMGRPMMGGATGVTGYGNDNVNVNFNILENLELIQ